MPRTKKKKSPKKERIEKSLRDGNKSSPVVIDHGVLVVNVCIGKTKYGTVDARTIQLHTRINLNESDMKAHELCSGDFISLMLDGKMILFGTAWSSPKTKPHMAAISSIWRTTHAHEQRENEMIPNIIVVKFTRPIESTSELSLKLIQPSMMGSLALGKSPEELQLLDRYIHAMLRGCFVFEGALLSLPVHGQLHRFQVETRAKSSAKGDVVQVGAQTQVKITWAPVDSPNSNAPNPPFEFATLDDEQVRKQKMFRHIGGLQREIDLIYKMIQLPLLQPGIFAQANLPPPKGVLMYGPPGTGKTLIARAVARSTFSTFFTINGPEIMSQFVGESESQLRTVFEQAQAQGPAIVFIDEIDALCPERHARMGEMEKRVVSTLLSLMDGLDSTGTTNNHHPSGQVIVLAATNRPNALDPALRRPGRLDREVEIGIPNEQARFEILNVCLSNIPHSVSETERRALTQRAHGFVGADIQSLVKEAGLVTLSRMKKAGSGSTSKRMNVAEFCLTYDDFIQARKYVQPSALREIAIEVPHVLWQDIGGQALVKQLLKEAVEWPLEHPEAFVRMGIRAPKGVLLYGPPGCSKTLTAKALATESQMNFIAVKGPELFSKYVGESEKAIQSLFRKARAAAPTIIFFDEIDAIAVQRGAGGGNSSQVADRVLSQLLNELDGIQPLKRVVIVAATNRPDIIDRALMRPGRIDRVIYVGLPEKEARVDILGIHTKKTPLHEDVNLDQIATATERYSGAELAALAREAAFCAMEEDPNISCVSHRHFQQALELIQPQIEDAMLEFYADFQKNFRS